MSWQALGAVLQASRFTQGRDFAGFRVLQAIAWFADEEGVAGRAGQPRACPTQETLARMARVHVNTVRNWLPKLEEAGELARERHGSGRGAHTVYRILLPMAGVDQREVREDGGTAKARRARREEGGEERVLAERVAWLERKLEVLLAREGNGGTAKARRARRGERGEERVQSDGGRVQVGGGRSQDSEERAQDSEERAQVGCERPQPRGERAQVGEGNPQVGGKKATRVQRGDVDDPLDPNSDPKVDPEGDPGGSTRGRLQARAEGHEARRAAPHPTPQPAPVRRSATSGKGQSTGGKGAGNGVRGNGVSGKGDDVSGGDVSETDVSPSDVSGSDPAFRERVAALAEVCGLDLRLRAHRQRCRRVARELAPYSAEEIRRRFGLLGPGSPRPEGWQWYVDDWRGARKREQPRLRDVVENISRQRVPPASPAPPPEPATRNGEVNGGQQEALPRQEGAVDGRSEPATRLGRAQIAFREFVSQEAANNGQHAVAHGA